LHIFWRKPSKFSLNLQMLFKGFPKGCDDLKLLRNGTLEMGSSGRWAAEWEAHAKPLVSEASLFFHILLSILVGEI
jgi:beta-1,4-mannosyltransferase